MAISSENYMLLKMLSHEVLLAGDWSVYEYRKDKWGGNPAYFNCNEKWEIEFLVRLMQDKFPDVKEEAIRNRIKVRCKTIRTNVLRELFIEYLMAIPVAD